MIKIIETGIEIDFLNLSTYNEETKRIAESIVSENPEAVILSTESDLVKLVDHPAEAGAVFVCPEYFRSTKPLGSQILIQLIAQARIRDWTFIILASKIDFLDKRVQYVADEIKIRDRVSS